MKKVRWTIRGTSNETGLQVNWEKTK